MKTIQEQHQTFYLIPLACRPKPKLKIVRHFFVIFYGLASKKNICIIKILIKMEIHRIHSVHEAAETFQTNPSRQKASSRHLRIVLELSYLDKTFLRHLQDASYR